MRDAWSHGTFTLLDIGSQTAALRAVGFRSARYGWSEPINRRWPATMSARDAIVKLDGHALESGIREGRSFEERALASRWFEPI